MAAEQDYAFAQYNLGHMNYEGLGVPQDYIHAHMWWNIVGTRGDATAVENRDIAAKQMTPDQIAEAQRMARAWLEAHPQ